MLHLAVETGGDAADTTGGGSSYSNAAHSAPTDAINLIPSMTARPRAQAKAAHSMGTRHTITPSRGADGVGHRSFTCTHTCTVRVSAQE